MGFLDGLGKAAGIGADVIGGYQQDQDAKLKTALAQAAADRQAQQDDLTQRIGASTIAHNNAETSNLLAKPPEPYHPIDPNSPAGIDAAIKKSLGEWHPTQNIDPLSPAGLAAKAQEPRNIDPNSPEGIDAAIKKAQGAPDHYTFPVGAEGILRGDTRTGELTPTGQAAKPPVTKIESATNTAAKARLEAAVSEMNNATTGMAEYEKGLANGTVNISGLGQLLGRVGGAFTHDDPASMAIQSAALDALNTTNPDLARYVRRGLSFAEGESMISQRPSDFRTKMSAFLSQAATHASPEMIQDIQSRRNSIMDPLNANVQPSPPGGAASRPAAKVTGPPDGGTKPTITQQEFDALKAQFPEATLRARYNIGG